MKRPVEIGLVANCVICMILLFTSGCVGNVQQIYRDKPYKSNNVDYANYKVGEEKTATIGEPIIEIKKYNQKTLLNAAARPTQDARIVRATCVALYGPCEEFLPSDRDYEILREVQYDNNEYYVVSTARSQISKLDTTTYSNSGWLILVRKDGTPFDQVFLPGPDSVLSNSLIIEPQGVKFEIKDRVMVDTKGFFEEKIIFTGITNDMINIRYISRGYDEADSRIDRQEDYQIPKTRETRFKRYFLKIIEAKADAIRYVVVSDAH